MQVPAPPQQTDFLDLFALHTQDESDVKIPASVLQQATPFEGLAATPAAPVQGDGAPIENPIIGGRVTICILMYGNYPQLHRQCLSAIISTIPAEQRQIRVGTNAVCQETMSYLSTMLDQKLIHKVIVNQTNIKKYPAMRQLLHDTDDPITDKWVIWFDDDSIANQDAGWFNKLLQKVVNTYSKGARLFGPLCYWKFNQQQVDWVRSRPWYRNRPLQTRNGRESPNGDHVQFSAGGFWMLAMDVARQAGIPDEQIGHNGGDYMIGEQVWQQGVCHEAWNSKKQFVRTSSVKRRGLREIHTARDPKWQPGGVPAGGGS